MTNVKPTVLSEGMACRAMADATFFTRLPEFSILRNQKQALDARNTATGCGGCRKRTLHTNLFREFVAIASALDANARERLRKYMGAAALMVNIVDPRTNQVQVRIL